MTILKINPLQIIQEYNDNNSLQEIATKYHTYPNKIKRLILKNGGTLRKNSDAQKISMAKGIRQPPFKGKKLPPDVKEAISIAQYDTWKHMPDEEYKRRVEIATKNWNDLSPAQKELFNKASIEGRLRAAKEGSIIELFLKKRLTEEKYIVEFHKEDFLPNEKMQIDLFLPELSIAIEVDGPSHFLPIWGQDYLIKTINADQRKNGLLIMYNIVVIRVKYLTTKTSNFVLRQTWLKVKEKIKEVCNKFPPPNQRLIEVEIL